MMKKSAANKIFTKKKTSIKKYTYFRKKSLGFLSLTSWLLVLLISLGPAWALAAPELVAPEVVAPDALVPDNLAPEANEGVRYGINYGGPGELPKVHVDKNTGHPGWLYMDVEDKEFFEAIGDIFKPIRRDILKLMPGYQTRSLLGLFNRKPPWEKEASVYRAKGEFAAAVNSLNNFNASIIHDERLAEILDDIIWDILDRDTTIEGLQDKKVFIADTIRDERLIYTLGEIIADFLRDERLEDDLKFFFTLVMDLLSDETMHYYIRDTIAKLIEDPRTAIFINDLISGVVGIATGTITGTLADLLADERIKETIGEAVMLFVEPVPDIIAGLVEDERLQQLSLEMAMVLVDHGPNMALDIMEDPRFVEILSEMIMMTIENIPETIAGTIEDGLPGVIINNVVAGLGDGTINSIASGMVGDFMKFQIENEDGNYIANSLDHFVNQYINRVSDSLMEELPKIAGLDLNDEIVAKIDKAILDASQIPTQLLQEVIFGWFVYGSAGYEDYELGKTYEDWVGEVMEAILNKETTMEIANEVYEIINRIDIPNFIRNNQAAVFSELEGALNDLPFDQMARDIKDDGRINEIPLLMVEKVLGNVPFAELGSIIREELPPEMLEAVVIDTVNTIPLAEVGAFLANDQRIPAIFSDALSGLPLQELATLIREDSRISEIISDIIKDFPVDTIIGFLQDDARAGLIGYTLSSTILNFVADLVEDEDLTAFIYSVIIDAVNEFGDSPGGFILSLLAKFFENEKIAVFLADALIDVTYEAEQELNRLFKLIVPNLFTGFIRELII